MDKKMSNEDMDEVLKEVYSFIITAEITSCNIYINSSLDIETINQKYKDELIEKLKKVIDNLKG